MRVLGGAGWLGLVACGGGGSSEDPSEGIDTVDPTGSDPTGGNPTGGNPTGGDPTGGSTCPATQACGVGCCTPEEVCVEGACVRDCGAKLACADTCCDPEAGEVCYVGQCVVPTGSCSEATCATAAGSGCDHGEVCAPELSQCVPDLADPTCAFAPEVGVFDPVPRFTWGRRQERDCDDGCQTAETCDPATNRCEPTWSHVEPAAADAPDSHQVVMTPMVADLDQDCIPEIIFSSYAGSRYTSSGVLRAIHGDDGSPYFTVQNGDYTVDPSGTPAIGDIDLDGMPEIITASPSNDQLLAFEHDGTPIWVSDSHSVSGNSGAPSLANFDNAGAPEIAYGNAIWDASGTLVFAGDGEDGTSTSALGTYGPLGCVADLTGDGRPELIAGAKTWTFTGQVGQDFSGSVYWEGEDTEGYCGVADLDLDGQPEVVTVFNDVRVFNGQTGELRGSLRIPGGGNGGAPNIADFDGDQRPDIGTAGGNYYIVAQFRGDDDLSILWRAATDDGSSHRTGSSVFDFDGDGRSEVVYVDEHFLRIYPGVEPGCPDAPTCDGDMTDDEVLFKDINSSRTRTEYPVIADVDGDFKAEIVVATNNQGWFADGGDAGIEVFEDRLDNWVGTRPIWNQHAYSITNVAVDGAVPEVAEPNWSVPADAPYNSYRQNAQGSLAPQCAPDLVPAELEIGLENCSDAEISLSVKVTNRGCLGVGPGVQVAFLDGSTVLGVATTEVAIPAGGTSTVVLSVPSPDESPFEISAVVDDDGAGAGSFNECREDNNTAGPVVLCEPIG